MNSDCVEIEDLLPAFSLGALEPDERLRVEAHLQGCERCRELAAGYEETVAAIPAGLAAASARRPPAGLRMKVLDLVAPEQKAPRETGAQRHGRIMSLSPRKLLRFQTVAAAVALIFVALSIGWGVRQTSALAKERSLRAELAGLVGQQQAIFDVVDSSRTNKAFLRAAQPNSSAYGKVYTRPDLSTVVVFVAQMPKLGDGQVDHLWLTAKGETRLAGTLTLNEQGFGALVFDAGGVGPAYEAAQVVMEPEDSNQPSGVPIVRWEAPHP